MSKIVFELAVNSDFVTVEYQVKSELKLWHIFVSVSNIDVLDY